MSRPVRTPSASGRGRREALPPLADLVKATLIPIAGQEKIFNMPKDSTVGDTLEAGGFDSDSEVRSNGDILDKNDFVKDGDKLIVLGGGKIEAGL